MYLVNNMKVFKIFMILVIVVYLILYFSYKNGYYIDKNKEKALLTEEKIKEYEEDLKNGVDVSKKDYVIVTESYDNTLTRISLKISKRIENSFDKVIKFLFNKISNTINE